MKNIRIFYLKKKNHFLVVNFSVYFNRLVFVMKSCGSVANSAETVLSDLGRLCFSRILRKNTVSVFQYDNYIGSNYYSSK